MRKLFGFILLLGLTACQEPLLESLPRYMREQDRFSRAAREGQSPADTLDPQEPVEPEEPEPEYIPSIYATALHFRDSLAELLFFKDGELLLQRPEKTPPDPERHRIWGGHLWSDSTDGHETVIFCDGEERFRFPGEEHLQGFMLVGEDVHTLGQHPGRDGFCYRINGNAVFESSRGSVLGSPSDPDWPGGALALDGEDIYYSYRVDQEYRVMKGAELYKTLPTGAPDALYDLRVHAGEVVRVEKRGSEIYWVAGERECTLRLFYPSLISCKLALIDDTVTVRGSNRAGGTTCRNWFFYPSQNLVRPMVNGESVRGCLVVRNQHWAFADLAPDGRFLTLTCEPEIPATPEGDYTLADPRGLYVTDAHCALALTSREGNTHAVLSDLGVTTYNFNGYFTSVRIE